MRPLLTAVCVAAAASSVRADEPRVRSSEELTSAEVAWAEPGFRVALSAGYELLLGIAPAPGARSIAPALHLGWRVNSELGLSATLRYSATHAGLGGLRATATVEPIWHVTDQVELAAGAGYVATLLSHDDPPPVPAAALEDAYDRGAELNPPVFGACDGHGIVALARATYLMRVGQLFSTGPMVQIDAQWVSCRDDDYVIRNLDDIAELTDNPGTMFTDGPTVELRQGWAHFTVGLSWVFAWR